jgi:formate dehydrogenase major subunit
MPLVKVEIDGKRVLADSGATILEVARSVGINIPTLCHDDQLEPFSSCYLCIVDVKGARGYVPACSTKISDRMVVETNTAGIREARRTALELLLSNHYADCVAPCKLACPAGVDVQGYIALAALGKWREAVALIKETNPLVAICGRVCTRPCEIACRRNILDDAVGIDYLKRYVADMDLENREHFVPEVAPPNGKRVAVIGGGPAGLSAAYYLAQKGYQVTILEAMPQAGGMLRYGIPEYRLPADILDIEINTILELGVDLRTNTCLGEDFTIRSLKEDGYEAVFMGLGAWKSSRLGVPSEDIDGVLSGIDFLRDLGMRKRIHLRGRVAVVGGGNTALDCARSALRSGADEVTIYYRRTKKEMPAHAMEIHEAEAEGVKIELLVAPTKVRSNNGRASGMECIRMELGEPDASGRRRPIPKRGSEFNIDCDYIFAAIGQSTKLDELLGGRIPDFLPPGEVIELTRWKTIRVSEPMGETDVEGVFAGGDVVTGAATVIEAVAAGRKAAFAIDAYLMKGRAAPEPTVFDSRKDDYGEVTLDDLRSLEEISRRKMPQISLKERKGNFEEVELGYSAEDVRREAARCLECGCSAAFTCQLRAYANEYGADSHRFRGEGKKYPIDRTHPLIELDPNKCILCGRCVRVCTEVLGIAALGFIHRGFDTIVRPAMGKSLLDTDCISCGLCVATCPTASIVANVPLPKPGPWQTTQYKTVCNYCGVGCRLELYTRGDILVKVAKGKDNRLTFGNHCIKGRFGYEFILSEQRLLKPMLRAGRNLQETDWDDALGHMALRLKEMARKHAPDEIAVFVSPRLTNEEIYLAQKFARIALGTHNVTSFSLLANQSVFDPSIVSTATYPDVAAADAVLLVNSILDKENMVADILVKRAIRKGGHLIYISPEEAGPAKFAEVLLKCRPGTETIVVSGLMQLIIEAGRTDLARLEEVENFKNLAGKLEEFTPDMVEDLTGVPAVALRRAAGIIAAAPQKVLIYNRDYRGPRAVGDVKVLQSAAKVMDARILSLVEKCNTQGLLDMGAHPAWYPGYHPIDSEDVVEEFEKGWCVALRNLPTKPADIADLLRQKKIKVAMIFGEDPLAMESLPKEIRAGLMSMECLIVADMFFTETGQIASAVFPLCSHAETSGTFTNSERRVQHLEQGIPPRAGLENWQIITQLAAYMGLRFRMNYADTDDIFREIRDMVPIYRDVVVDSQERDGLWDLDRFLLKPEKYRFATKAIRLQPVKAVITPTLHLDFIERRFEARMEQLFARTRKEVPEPAAVA